MDIVPIKSNMVVFNDKFGKVLGNMTTPSAGPVFARISTNKSRFSIARSGEDPVYIKNGKDFVSELPVVVLSANPGVHKVYYKNKYVPGSDPKAPECWSTSGDKPHPMAAEKQAPSCSGCPHNVFGSKISETGAKTKACGDSKRLLVVSPNDIKGDVYMVNVSATALKPWNTYIKMLTRGGVYPQGVITVLSFEEDIEYPRLKFEYGGTLSVDDITDIVVRLDEDAIAEFTRGEADTETEFVAVAGPEDKAPTEDKAPLVKGFGTDERGAEKATVGKKKPVAHVHEETGDTSEAGSVSPSIRSLLDF